MSPLSTRLARLGVVVPEILLPAKGVSPEKWAVIACDQFSSDRDYWAETGKIVGDHPSTLNLIVPECYLDDPDRSERESRAGRTMKEYIDNRVLEPREPGFVFVERSTPFVARREGLVLALDLEAYDFSEGSRSVIRPTEGTIRDRLPPRMAVRRQAALDLPHILVLIDDPDDRVMAAARTAAGAGDAAALYDFSLMQGGGTIRGRHIAGDNLLEPVVEALEELASRSDLLFAVGDGNHSLASAREVWREKKSAGARNNHPARYALVEVENIHDPGLPFHPIHRVLFNVQPDSLSEQIRTSLDAETRPAVDGALTEDNLRRSPEGRGRLGVSFGNREVIWEFPVPRGILPAEILQEVLDEALSAGERVAVDYIHGDDAVRSLVGDSPDRLGFILPPVDKSTFFTRIAEIGPYPRKTFSIGEAEEKRYYLETRKLDPSD